MDSLLRWLFYSVMLGLLPIFAGWFNARLGEGGTSWSQVIAHGELLLPTAAICAASIGELVAGKVRHAPLALISGGVATLVLALSCMYYVLVSTAIPGRNPDPDAIALVSLAFYVSAVVSGTACRCIRCGGEP